MPIKERNNDQNINRSCTKMTERCSSLKYKPKLTGALTEKPNNIHENCKNHSLSYTYDNLYTDASDSRKNSSNAHLHSEKSNGTNSESEVRFLEEWLFLHLDLIQQQNDEILSKERTIYLLEQENEMLREHINCLQGGIGYSPRTGIKSYITQDAAHLEDDKSLVYSCASQTVDMNNCIKNCATFNSILSYKDSILNRSRIQAPCDIDSPVKNGNIVDNSLCVLKQPPIRNKNDIEVNNCEDADFQVSIGRKRLCSGSSAFSNSTSIEEAHSSVKKRKTQKIIKDGTILTSNEYYVTQASGIAKETECYIIPSSNLEVPRWRVHIYTSLYSMEGTENLDDEVFNKRHMRLENDERRRKRWDVQRIREQRVVEKLKLRQERISCTNINDKTKPITSLWPSLEDIKYIEVCDDLPVSAFGAPVPRLSPSEFSLPWLNNSVEQNIEPKLEVLLEQVEPLPQLEDLALKKVKRARKQKRKRKPFKR